MSERIPEFQKTMLPILTYLQDGQPHGASTVLDAMATYYGLTDEELQIKVPSGQMGLFKNRIVWAASYLKNAGLVYYPVRATYQITDEGRKALSDNPGYINIAYLKKFEGFQKWKATFNKAEPKKEIATDVEEGTPEEIVGATINALNTSLEYELLETLKKRQDKAKYFEHFVLRLLVSMGYGGVEEKNFEVTGMSGDNGIDGIIYQDSLGIERIYVQAKCWFSSKVASKEIRDFIGSLSLRGTSKGIFITTSSFTEDALNTVKMNPQNRIILIDGSRLAQMAIKNNIGVQVKKTYLVKEIDNEFFDDL